MVEWSITVVLKTTVLRGTGGSNPSLTWNLGESTIFDRKSTQNITIEALYFCFSLAV